MVNPNGVVAWDEARWPQPRWGWGLMARFTQGSSRLATLGFETESLWDSYWLEHRDNHVAGGGMGMRAGRFAT